jgi:catalase
MNGYSSHTYSWVNPAGERFWVKYHFKTVQGIENFTDAEAGAMAAADPDYHRRDLWEAIASGNAPEWRLEMQIMPFTDAADYRFNPFDLTKVWPHEDYPPITVGRLVLDRNPANHFAEVEQSAFEPSNLVPGIGLSPDKMLMGRIFSYHDTHLHRIGPNYEQLPVNAPKSPVRTYSKDGPMAYHATPDPVYAPNSFGGPQADPNVAVQPSWAVETAEIGRYAYAEHRADDNFIQPRALYQNVMSETDREHLVSNIAAHIKGGVTHEMLPRVIEYWRNVHPDLGARVAKEVNGG